MKAINAVKCVLNIDTKYGQIDDGLNTFVSLVILNGILKYYDTDLFA